MQVKTVYDMRLVDKDYQNIARMISEPGIGTVEYSKEGEVLCVTYDYWEKGYVEDDYFRGTGARVITDWNMSVVKTESMDEEGNPTPNDFDENILIKVYESNFINIV